MSGKAEGREMDEMFSQLDTSGQAVVLVIQTLRDVYDSRSTLDTHAKVDVEVAMMEFFKAEMILEGLVAFEKILRQFPEKPPLVLLEQGKRTILHVLLSKTQKAVLMSEMASEARSAGAKHVGQTS